MPHQRDTTPKSKTHNVRSSVIKNWDEDNPSVQVIDAEGAKYALKSIRDLLWIDAFEDGPWTPSYIDRVILERSDGIIVYERADDVE